MMNYMEIGVEGNDYDVWVFYDNDYKKVPNEYGTHLKETFHKGETSSLLAGRIDHTQQRISIRENELKIPSSNVSYVANLLKTDYPTYQIWFFPNIGKPEKIN